MRKKFALFTATIALTIPIFGQFTTPAKQLEKHVYKLASNAFMGRGFGTEEGAKAAEYIAKQYKNAGIEPLRGSYFHPFNYRSGILNISGTNVAGIITGSDPNLRDEYILLGAHFDHLGWKMHRGDTVVYNGADDNASGTATIIEIGRNLASKKETLGRSIILVAFDGEESGLVGSNRFIKDTLVPLHKIKLMFSLDMVGMYEAHGGLDLAGVKLLTDFEQIVGKLANEYNVTITKANKSLEQRTDTAPFGAIGIPAVHAFTGTESPYHKPEDVAEGLDYQGMALVTNYLSAAAQQLSSAENISRLQGPGEGRSIPPGPKVFRPGIRINAGTNHHNYQDEFYDGKPVFSGEAGLFASISAARFLIIQPEVLYQTIGSQHPGGNFRTHSITTPVTLLFSSPAENMIQTYFLFGGYFSYHFGGTVNRADIDFRNVYDNQEVGLSYGFGLQVMNVQVGMIIRNGLSNIWQDPAPGIVTNEGVFFSLGFIF